VDKQQSEPEPWPDEKGGNMQPEAGNNETLYAPFTESINGRVFVPPGVWGRDHLTTLLYVETRVVDNLGVLDNRKMRCDPALHPDLHTGSRGEYPTQLRFGAIVNRHDDWSCLEDAAAADLLFLFYKPGGARVVLTQKGWKIIHSLRKAKGVGMEDYYIEVDRVVSSDPNAYEAFND
jgi:hypothetical protein